MKLNNKKLFPTCEKCGEDIVLGKWCSYKCLEEEAERKGVSPDVLLKEMENDALNLESSGNV